MPGSRAPPCEITNIDCPGAFACMVSTTTDPFPETPPEEGGRVAVTCTVPVLSSSRCASATAWPSCESSPPLETLITCKTLGSYVTCNGTEKTLLAPFKSTLTLNVDPFGWVRLGGSKTNLPL